MDTKTNTDSGATAETQRAEDILRCYPAISAEETRELITFLKHGKIIEIGRVTSIPELRENVEAFRREHRRAFALGFRDYLKFAIFVAVPAGLVFWLIWAVSPK
ncbi:MAG: hypothetical protein KF889_00320 [Alphaproteobacteria bacterium]|nr:hypothetical protein [Alphaproteobacteria bacterium]MCW5743231.1 hypothetical protein [Alphaproteobacteria bacterium]